MTEEQKNNFLEFFGKYPLSEILSSRQNQILIVMGVAEPDQLSGIEGYGEYYKIVTDIAGMMEKIAKLESADMQTKDAISFVGEKLKTANTDSVVAADKLIRSRLFIHWDEKNQERYTTGKKLLLDWIHFFISYTNSSMPSINNTYKSLLRSQLGTTYINNNKEKMNLMAALLYKFFKTQKMNTFYDKEKIDWSEDFKKIIFTYTQKSFAFVQFIEPDIFYGTNADNYCYQEYKSYLKSVADFADKNKLKDFAPVFFFIISNPSNSREYKYRPANLEDAELNTWADYIKDNQYVTLHAKMTDEELELQIQKASYKIVELKKTVFRSFLNSF